MVEINAFKFNRLGWVSSYEVYPENINRHKKYPRKERTRDYNDF